MHIKGVLLALALTAPATLAMLPPKAHAADGTLYEVSEAIDLKSNGKGFKSSEATLSGRINAGTPLCPSLAATALERAVSAGTLTPAVVESLYDSWIRQGEYVKARDRFEALAKANPNAAPVRLAAARAGDDAARHQLSYNLKEKRTGEAACGNCG
jgi:hypothetical protein